MLKIVSIHVQFLSAMRKLKKMTQPVTSLSLCVGVCQLNSKYVHVLCGHISLFCALHWSYVLLSCTGNPIMHYHTEL